MKLVFCLPGLHFTSGFVWSWTKTLLHFERKGTDILTSFAQNSNVTMCRNMTLRGMDIFGEELLANHDYDYMMWLDSDTVFKPEHIEMLLEADKDIISGLVPIDWMNNLAVGDFLLNGALDMLNYNDIPDGESEPFQVRYAGFAFLLVKRGVFEKLGYPYFIQTVADVNNKKIMYGEDIIWCMRVQELGYTIWAHPQVVLGHEKTLGLKVT